MRIEVGEIYKLSQNNQTIKVIGVDEYEVLYDFYWSHNNLWAFSSNLNKKGFFYRMNKEKFLSSIERIDYEELTPSQFNVLRPDLPIRIARVNNISWEDDIFNSKIKFENSTNLSYDSIINCDAIWLYPLSSDKKPLKPKLISAKNKNLTLEEILTNASELEKANTKDKSKGIGIYRLGINRKKPSFYIGEYLDLLGNG